MQHVKFANFSLQAGALGTMPNLRSLKLNIDGKVADFNLASLLSGNLALQTLHIKLIGEGITGGRHKANVQGSGTALRHELQENLPMRLQQIVLQGENIENIHPAAFKVRSSADTIVVHYLKSYAIAVFTSQKIAFEN